MTVPTIDDVLAFPATGSGASNDFVGDGYWWLALTEISMPFQEADFNDPTQMVTKVRFYFDVAGTYDRKTGDVAASESDGSQVSIKIKADSNGPKSTKYLLASALLGQDLAGYIAANGPVLPSQLIGLCCWGKIENEAGKKDPSTSYTKLMWNGFSAQLPPHLLRPAAPGARPGPQRQPLGTLAQQPPQATGKSPF